MVKMSNMLVWRLDDHPYEFSDFSLSLTVTQAAAADCNWPILYRPNQKILEAGFNNADIDCLLCKIIRECEAVVHWKAWIEDIFAARKGSWRGSEWFLVASSSEAGETAIGNCQKMRLHIYCTCMTSSVCPSPTHPFNEMKCHQHLQPSGIQSLSLY